MASNRMNSQIESAIGIHSLIEKQAFLRPNAPAVICNDKSLSYKELNEKSNQLAHSLIAKGVTVETLVGVSINRSIEMVVAVIGILKAGAAYVPIDPDYPKERINYMISDSGIKFLITQCSLLDQIPASDIEKTCLDTPNHKIDTFPLHNPWVPINTSHLAYVLYTSGSTGNPKGVMVCHENLIQAYNGWEKVYELTETDCHLQMANFSFDVFSGDLVRALCSGGKLVLCPREILLAPDMLYTLMQKEKINCAEFVPTVLRRLIEYIEKKGIPLNFMRLLICGSDNWSVHEYRKLQRLCENKARVINSYGLTEATIDSTYFESKLDAKEPLALDHTVPIGKPFPNTEVFLLNEDLTEVPSGETGEIYISGPGLARGYFNQPELTLKKFISHPLTQKPLYKTGDLGRLLPDGNIEFLGRIDNQVKLRGMRIELSDIENVLNYYPSIKESLVMLAEEDSQHKRLVAYIILDQGTKTDVRKLRAFLQKRLPHYMVPSIFIRLTSLPMTPNGKLDRRALKEKAISLMTNEHSIAPRNSIEKQLVNSWKRLLHVNKIGVFDNFHDVGGDSFLLAQLCCEIENNFLIKISACEMPKDLTVANLAQHIMKMKHFEKSSFETSRLVQSGGSS